MSMIEIPSRSWFDNFPTEIIYHMFDYLSNNDLLYSFFDVSVRMNSLILRNRRYLTYFKYSSSNLNKWKKIISMICSQIECLNIITDDFHYSLNKFSNVRSLILCSFYGMISEELTSIINADQFRNLERFEIREDENIIKKFFLNRFCEQDELFEDIFNNGHRLEKLILPTFEITNINHLNIHFKLRSLRINIDFYWKIFVLINLIPNLEYLNIQSYIPHTIDDEISMINTNVKLKEFYLTFDYKVGRLNDSRWENSFDQINIGVNLFSSSLICLSLNLISLPANNLSYSSSKLQQLLEPMKELKEFHLYTRLPKRSINYTEILSSFENQFWIDHHWSFGIHANYFYTLPFHFHFLYEFDQGLHAVQTTNPRILSPNSRLWFSVKSIQFTDISIRDNHWIEQINIEMPQLISITFLCHTESNQSNENIDKISYSTLNHVRILGWNGQTLESIKEWCVHRLPNLKHFILYNAKMLTIDNQLVNIFNQKIERLSIDWYSNFEQLTQITDHYFSNVQYVDFWIGHVWQEPQPRAQFLMNILKNFKNLKILTVYLHSRTKRCEYSSLTELTQLISCSDMNQIQKNYHIKRTKVIFSCRNKIFYQ